MATETVKTLRFDIETNTGTSAAEITKLMDKMKSLGITLRDFAITQQAGLGVETSYNNSILISASSIEKLKEAYTEALVSINKFNRAKAEAKTDIAFIQAPDTDKVKSLYNQIVQEVTRGYTEAGKKQSEILKASNAESINLLNYLASEESRIILNGNDSKLTIQRRYANESKAIFVDLAQKLAGINRELALATDPEAYMKTALAASNAELVKAEQALKASQIAANEALLHQEQVKRSINEAKTFFSEYLRDYRDEVDAEIRIAKVGAETIHGIELQRKADILQIRRDTDRELKALLSQSAAKGVSVAPGTPEHKGMAKVAEGSTLKERMINAEAKLATEEIAKKEAEYKKRNELFTQFASEQNKIEASLVRAIKAEAKKGTDTLEQLEVDFQQKLLQIDTEFAAKRKEIEEKYYAYATNKAKTVQSALEKNTREKEKAIRAAYVPIKEYKDAERVLADLVSKETEANKKAVSDLSDRMALELMLYRKGIASKEYALLKLTQEEKALRRNLAGELDALTDKINNKSIKSTIEAEAERLRIITKYEADIRKVMSQIAAVEPNAEKVNAYNMSLLQSISHYTRVYLIMGAIYKVSTEINKVLDEIPKAGIELEATTASLQATMGSATETGLQLAELTEEAKRTGIPLKELRENFRNFAASTTMAGESTATTWKIFKDMNTAMTTLHMSGDKTSHTFLALAQMFNKSKIQSEELVKQLSNYLPGAFASFAAATGRTTLRLAEDMKKGTVQAHEEMAKFADFMAKRFGGGAFTQARAGLNAAIGDYQTAVLRLEETVFKKLEGTGKGLIKTVTEYIDKIREASENTYTFATAVGALKGSLDILIAIAASSAFVNMTKAFAGLSPAAKGITALAGAISGVTIEVEKTTAPFNVLIENLGKLEKLPEAESDLKSINLLEKKKKLLEDIDQVRQQQQTYTTLDTGNLIDRPLAWSEAKIRLEKFIDDYKKAGYKLKIAGEDITLASLGVSKDSDTTVIYHKFFTKAREVLESELKKTEDAIKAYQSTAPEENAALFAPVGVSDKDMAAFTKSMKARLESQKKIFQHEYEAFKEQQQAIVAEAESQVAPSGTKSLEEVRLVREQAAQALYEKRLELRNKELDLTRQLIDEEVQLGIKNKDNLNGLIEELPKAVRRAESSITDIHAQSLKETLRKNLVTGTAGNEHIGPMQVSKGAYLDVMGKGDEQTKRYKDILSNMLRIGNQANDELTELDKKLIAEIDGVGQQYLQKQIETFKDARLAILAYHDGPTGISKLIKEVAMDSTKITEEEILKVISKASAEGQKEVSRVQQFLVKGLTLSKGQRDELAFSADIASAELDKKEAGYELDKAKSEALKKYNANLLEQDKLITNTKLKLQEQIDSLMGIPATYANQWARATKDTENVITVLRARGTEEEKATADLIEKQLKLSQTLAKLKDSEVASQERLNRAMKLAQLEQRSITAREKGGELSTWDAMIGRSKSNEREAKALQDRIDKATQNVSSQYWDTGVITQGMQADIDSIQEWRVQLQELKLTGNEVATFMRSTLTDALGNSFNGFITGAMNAEDAMRNFATSILSSIGQILANKMATSIIDTVISGAGGFFPSLGGLFTSASADGNIFTNGNIVPFASGGIVNSPKVFPMARGGIGLMGEAGPEAIIPLKRGKDGKLGVSGGATNVTNNSYNISVTIEKYTGKDDPDITGAKIAEIIARKIAREEIASASRKGNRLNPIGAF